MFSFSSFAKLKGLSIFIGPLLIAGALAAAVLFRPLSAPFESTEQAAETESSDTASSSQPQSGLQELSERLRLDKEAPFLQPPRTAAPAPGARGSKKGTLTATLPDGTVITDVVTIGAQGDILIREEDAYQIVFLNQSQQFLLAIYGYPFDQARSKAERAFVDAVAQGVTEKACAKTVRVVPMPFAHPDREGREYPLSFCTYKQKGPLL